MAKARLHVHVGSGKLARHRLGHSIMTLIIPQYLSGVLLVGPPSSRCVVVFGFNDQSVGRRWYRDRGHLETIGTACQP